MEGGFCPERTGKGTRAAPQLILPVKKRPGLFGLLLGRGASLLPLGGTGWRPQALDEPLRRPTARPGRGCCCCSSPRLPLPPRPTPPRRLSWMPQRPPEPSIWSPFQLRPSEPGNLPQIPAGSPVIPSGQPRLPLPPTLPTTLRSTVGLCQGSFLLQKGPRASRRASHSERTPARNSYSYLPLRA